MRIGIHGGAVMIMGAAIEEVAAHAAEAEADGFASYWVPQSGGTDALTVIAVLGAATSTIEFATAVIPTWGRHPHVLAGQALTVQAATGDRLALGIGVAHKPSVEDRYHIPFERPVRHLREYLDVLQPLLAERQVDVVGEIWSFTGDLVAPPADAAAGAGRRPRAAVPPPGRQAGRRHRPLAGGADDGGRPHRADHHRRGRRRPGAAAPRVVASVPVSVTDRPDEVRSFISEILAGYDTLPSYRAMLDREGAVRAGDVAVIGNEDEVRDGLARFADAGATDFAAVEIGLDGEGFARTRALLTAINRA